jgi:hypothetical protein
MQTCPAPADEQIAAPRAYQTARYSAGALTPGPAAAGEGGPQVVGPAAEGRVPAPKASSVPDRRRG